MGRERADKSRLPQDQRGMRGHGNKQAASGSLSAARGRWLTLSRLGREYPPISRRRRPSHTSGREDVFRARHSATIARRGEGPLSGGVVLSNCARESEAAIGEWI
ncbi:hypothetical protein AAFF_G00053530 [Aldrovandia affinis]|uniref:Uncharacterized protein n=1 Tax=Aldrovandia affinis TaxID=143900 RepID=A0AAD7S121_9TELE|nr:hypothetical protein AAFF_G00053530 [Aldrovandia affinis]